MPIQPTYAQDAGVSEILVNYVETDPRDDQLGLRVYFTLLNADGSVAAEQEVSSAEIYLPDGQIYPIASDRLSNNLTTPLYITIALDLSGSMGRAEAVGAMRDAAIQAIENAPPNAQFAIVRFNDAVNASSFLTKQAALIEVNNISETAAAGGTRLYDASWEAVNMVVGASSTDPQGRLARRAVIVFTDGRDEQVQGEGIPYSFHTFEEVVAAAQNPLAPVPIHTIGLGDIDPLLAELSLRTGGRATVTSDQTNLSNSFAQIMDGLRGQWLASTDIYPTETGLQTPRLEVRIDDNRIIDKRFELEVRREYEPPSEAPIVEFIGIEPNENASAYRLLFDITNPETIGKLRVLVNADGTLVQEEELLPSGPYIIDGTNLLPGVQYTVELFVFDTAGERIMADGVLNQGQLREFVHNPPMMPLSIELRSISIEETTQEMVIDTVVGNVDGIASFEVNLFNKDGLLVDKLLHDFRTEPQLRIPIATLRGNSGLEASDYRIVVNGLAPDETTVLVSAENNISYSPPERPGFFRRIFNALGSNPIYLLTIIGLLLTVIGWFMYNNWRSKRTWGTPSLQRGRLQAIEPPAPAMSVTEVVNVKRPAAGQQQPKPAPAPPPPVQPPQPAAVATITIIQQSNSGFATEREVVVSTFPLPIGRGKLPLKIEDSKVSRRHAEITFEDGDFYITDLGSTNGVVINGKAIEQERQHRLVSQRNIDLVVSATTTLRFRGEVA